MSSFRYFCGHDHTMQYIQEANSTVSYFVTGAGHLTDPSEAHKVNTKILSVLDNTSK